MHKCLSLLPWAYGMLVAHPVSDSLVMQENRQQDSPL